MYIVDSRKARLVSEWGKLEMLAPDFDMSKKRIEVPTARKGVAGTPSASDIDALKNANWSGVWWAPDCRALCCTASRWALIVFFDDSLSP